MKYISDLHTHSNASDGQYTPAELVLLAKARGIDVLALTDHDTVNGIPEAIAEGELLGLCVIPGIEMSAKEYHTFHILGYGFLPEEPVFRALCERLQCGRNDRVYRILEYLSEKGVLLSAEEVAGFSGGGVIGRPHFAQAMLARGAVKTWREAFDRYLDTDEFHERIERDKPPVRECIETLKGAGEKVSLAHPYQIGLANEALDKLVGGLVEYGLDAIKCYYPRFSSEQQAFYLRLAEKYGLHVTGGSDFHGERVKPDISLAALALALDWLLS